MTGPDPDEAARTRRLRAMGGVLRDASSDETADGWSEVEPTAGSPASEEALRREVPPHHGS